MNARESQSDSAPPPERARDTRERDLLRELEEVTGRRTSPTPPSKGDPKAGGASRKSRTTAALGGPVRHALGCAALVFLLAAAPAAADVTFSPTATNIPTTTIVPSDLATADFNNDGNADLVSADCGDVCTGTPIGSDGAMTFLLGNGLGGFSTAPGDPLPPPGVTSPQVLSTGDFDDNGRTDVAVGYGNSGNHHVIYRGRDNSTDPFVDGTDQGADGGSTEGSAIGDINGDGNADLVVARSSAGLAVRLGDGTGNVGAPTTVTGTTGAGLSTEGVALADLDGDGDLDVVTGLLGGGVLVLRNNGTGTLALVDRFGGGDTVREVKTADLNRDGDLDLILAGEGRG